MIDQMVMMPYTLYKLRDPNLLCAIKDFFLTQNDDETELSPSTKAAAYMFLSDDGKALLHDGHAGIRRKAQTVKACMG